MDHKTFAYQLGETHATEVFHRRAKTAGVANYPVEAAAEKHASYRYLDSDAEYGEYVEGYTAAWASNLALPEFLWGAPIEPSVIATQPALRAALEAALPNVNQLGFHDQLATLLVEHLTRKPEGQR